MKLKAKITVIAAAFVGVVGFQNCSQVGFSQSPGVSQDNSTSTASGSNDGGISSSSSNSGTNDGNVVDVGTATPTTCQQMVQITPVSGSPTIIPARDNSATCYYVKLFSAVNYTPSNTNTNPHDTEVVARAHDIDMNNAAAEANPYVLGEAQVRISMAANRVVKLSGGSTDTAMTLDNFILVGIAPSGSVGNPQYYHAYGTGDSTVYNPANSNDSSGIIFNNQYVNLTAFISGGTSTVAPLSLQGSMELNADYTVDVRALDCGGGHGIIGSDVYLLIE